MERPPLSVHGLEAAMSRIFTQHELRGSYFPDEDIERIRNLLLKMGKKSWSARPRIYAVLRMMGKENELMDKFVQEDLFDIQFPYNSLTLPLNIRSPSDRRKFLEKQAFVLTEAKDVETGSHAHLATDADTHFHVIRLLGRGGFGSVEEVTSNLSFLSYARKTLLRNKIFTGSESQERSFRNELQNLKRLSHHHLVKYIGSYTDPRCFGILLLPIADLDLQEYLSKPTFTTNELRLIRQFFGCITSGLAYLHRNSCRHKDIKPGNILIKRGEVYITDFGLAYDWTEASKSRTTGEAGAMSRGYVAPEVWEELPRRSSADMWSLGCVFLDMTTVLKGESLEAKRDFFRCNGSKGLNPRENDEAYNSWMDKLNSRHDQLPWLWTKELIVRKPDDRLTALELLQKIQRCVDREDGYMYYCKFCDESNEESIAIPDLARVIQGTTEEKDDADINTITISNIRDGLQQAVTRDDQSDARLWLKRWEKINVNGESCQASLGSHTKALHLAALQGNCNIAADLLKYGFDVNAKSMGSTPLHIAVENGKEAIMELLVDQGADTNACHDNGGYSVLHIAAARGSRSAVAFLLQHGAKLNAIDGINSTPLHRAAFLGHEEVLGFLLKQDGINTTIHNFEGVNPLQGAAFLGHERAVEMLLDHGVDIDARDSKLGGTALHYAVVGGKIDIVELLIRKGAQLNTCQTAGPRLSPLHLAAANGRVEEAKRLLASKADPEITCTGGGTALHQAVVTGNVEMASLLIENGCNINKSLSNGTKAVPLSMALGRRDVAMAELLLKHHADTKATGASGDTCLHNMVFRGDQDMVELLLRYDSEIDPRDASRKTPLMAAALAGKAMIAKRLLDKGADVHAKDIDYKTALYFAVQAGHEEVAKLLLENNADVNAQGHKQTTALHVATILGNVGIAQLLLEAGAKVDVEDGEMHTPLWYAMDNKHAKLVQLLESSSKKPVGQTSDVNPTTVTLPTRPLNPQKQIPNLVQRNTF